jgi:putative protein kinase ArgK-like GTPase of G3E family
MNIPQSIRDHSNIAVLVETKTSFSVFSDRNELFHYNRFNFVPLLKISSLCLKNHNGIKKGILELADAIVINKADGEFISQATNAMAQYQSALHLMMPQSTWAPPAMTCSALNGTSLDLIYKMLNDYKSHTHSTNYFHEKRMKQNKNWFLKLIQHQIQMKLDHNQILLDKKKELEMKVLEEKMLPLKAADEYIELVSNHFRAGK